MTSVVIVTVEGGAVQCVECPPGVTVRVRDYDIPEGDPDRGHQDEGGLYVEYVWGGEPAVPGG